MWQGIEDMLLDIFVTHLKARPLRHLSLHFDGIRVDRQRVLAEAEGGSEEDGIRLLLANLTAEVARQTGYNIEVVEKRHEYLLDKLRRHAGRTKLDVDIPPRLLEDGNCIPLAIASVRSGYANIAAALLGSTVV